MVKDSFDPIEVGMALWEAVALQSILYGIQVVSLTKSILTDLDSIQASFAADLMGVSRSSSHTGILREMGWGEISTTITKRKLIYWSHLAALDDANWAKKTLNECASTASPHRGGWSSSYRKEIQDILISYKLTNIVKDNNTPGKHHL